MGHGTVGRFNATLLNWRATRKTTGKHTSSRLCTHKILLVTIEHVTVRCSLVCGFGSNPRLAVDICLGLSTPEEPTVNAREHYATKLRKQLNFEYKVASTSADRH